MVVTIAEKLLEDLLVGLGDVSLSCSESDLAIQVTDSSRCVILGDMLAI